jgi:hypothetical protein
MSQPDTVEELTAQRDALAKVVLAAWNRARDSIDIDPGDLQEWMAQAGLTEAVPATEEEAEKYEIDPGDPLMRLSALGRAALLGWVQL